MVVSEVSDNLLFGGISLTDWIQAMGAIIAIVAAIIGFVKLFRRDKDRQTQIDSLTKIAEESTYQTSHLANQVEKMAEGNALQTEYIKLFEKALIQSEEKDAIEQERFALEKRKRRMEIKPRFEKNGGSGNRDKRIIKLKNSGGDAQILGFTTKEKNKIHHNLVHYKNKLIKRGVNLELEFKSALPGIEVFRCSVDLEVSIRDEDENKYLLRITGFADSPSIHVEEIDELTI